MSMNRRKFLKTGTTAFVAASLPTSRADAENNAAAAHSGEPEIATAYPPTVVGKNPERADPNNGYNQLTAGPMIGAVTPSEITFWTRTSDEYDVQIEYGLDQYPGHAQRSKIVKASVKNDLVSSPLAQPCSDHYLGWQPELRILSGSTKSPGVDFQIDGA